MTKRFWTLPGTVMTAGLLVVLTSNHFASRHRTPGQNTDADAVKKDRVLACSQALLPTLMAGAKVVHSELTMRRFYGVSGRIQTSWIVDCSDTTSRRNAQIVWNGETGELIAAHQWTEPEPILAVDAPSSRNAALAHAWDWFSALAIRRDHETWRLAAARPTAHANWKVRLQCEGRATELTVNTVTGQLVRLVCTPLPDPKAVATL